MNRGAFATCSGLFHRRYIYHLHRYAMVSYAPRVCMGIAAVSILLCNLDMCAKSIHEGDPPLSPHPFQLLNVLESMLGLVNRAGYRSRTMEYAYLLPNAAWNPSIHPLIAWVRQVIR